MNQIQLQQQGTDLSRLLSQADGLCRDGRFEEALDIYQHLIGVCEARVGPSHPDTVFVVQRLADCLYALNRFRDCLPLYQRLSQLARERLGEGHVDVLNLMFKIARAQESIGSFQEARSTYEKTIEVARRTLPAGHELTKQLQGRLEVLVERIEENKRAAQAWRDNTGRNPAVPAASLLKVPPHMTADAIEEISSDGQIQSPAMPPAASIGLKPKSAPITQPQPPVTPNPPKGSPRKGAPPPPFNPWEPEPQPSPSPAAPPVPSPSALPPAASLAPPLSTPPPVAALAPRQPTPPAAASPAPPQPTPPPVASPAPPRQPTPPSDFSSNPQPDSVFSPDRPQPSHLASQPPFGSGTQSQPLLPPSSPSFPQNQPYPWSAPPGPPSPAQASPSKPPDLKPWEAANANSQPAVSQPSVSPWEAQTPETKESAPHPLPSPKPAENVGAPMQNPWEAQPSLALGAHLMEELRREETPSGMLRSMPPGVPGDPFSRQGTPFGNPNAPFGDPGAPTDMQFDDPEGSPFADRRNMQAAPADMQFNDPEGSPFADRRGMESAAMQLGDPFADRGMMQPGPPEGMPFGNPDAAPPRRMAPFGYGGVQFGDQSDMPGRPAAIPSGASGGFQFGVPPMSASGSMTPNMVQPNMPAGPSAATPGIPSAGQARPKRTTESPSDIMRAGTPDPYLDHLAAKVANLQAQRQVPETGFGELKAPSRGDQSGWHDTFSIPANEMKAEPPRKRVPTAHPIEDDTAYGEEFPDDGQIDTKQHRAPAGIRSARAVASRSDGIVSAVRALKEYLVPVLLLVVVAGFGLYMFRINTAPKPPAASTVSVPSAGEQAAVDATTSEATTTAPLATAMGKKSSKAHASSSKAHASSSRSKPGKTKGKPGKQPSNVAVPGSSLAIPAQPPMEKGAEVYATPDNAMRFIKRTNDQCELCDAKNSIYVQCVVYDGTPGIVARQAVDSLLERQVWLAQTKEGMKTDSDLILYAKTAPDWKAIDKIVDISQAAARHYLIRREYPKDLKETNAQPYMYANPFTGATKLVPMLMIHEADNNRNEIVQFLRRGALLVGESAFDRGEIRCYCIAVTSKGPIKGVGFFVRGADQNGNFFRVKDTGEVLVLGQLEGKDTSNAKMLPDSRNQTLTAKPTKVWIAKNQSLPLFILYHIVPIALAVVAMSAYWRSLMLLPGKLPDNPVNKGFRIFSIIVMVLTLVSVGLQYMIWL